MPALGVEAAEKMNAAVTSTRIGVKSGVKTAQPSPSVPLTR